MSTYEPIDYDRRFLRLLKTSPFQQRPGGWRFGTKRISDDVVARLIASGAARIDGARLIHVEFGGAGLGASSAALRNAGDAPMGGGGP